MQADDIALAQQLIELYLLDRQIIDPKRVTFETEHPAAKGVAQACHLQPDGAQRPSLPIISSLEALFAEAGQLQGENANRLHDMAITGADCGRNCRVTRRKSWR